MRSPFFERQDDIFDDACAMGDCAHIGCNEPLLAVECPCCKGDRHDPELDTAPETCLGCYTRVDLLLAAKGPDWHYPHETYPDPEPFCRRCFDTGVVPTEEARA